MNNFTKITAVVLVLIAVVLGILAFLLGHKPAVPPSVKATPALAATAGHAVVISDRELPAGKPIDATDVRIAQMPISPVGAFTAVPAVVGKIPRMTLAAGIPITDSALDSGLAMQLNSGERGVAIGVDEIIGAGNNIQPGDYVDVFLTLREGQDITKTQARLLLPHVRVLAYGADALGVGGIVNTSAPQNGNRPPPSQSMARTAVLAVPVQDVDALILGTQSGKLILALRQPTDATAPDPSLFPTPEPVLAARSGLDAQQLAALSEPGNRAYSGLSLAGLAGDGKVVAAPPPHRSVVPRQHADNGNSIEIIRGSERQNVSF